MISHVLLIPINGIGEFSGLIDIARERIGKSFVNKKIEITRVFFCCC